LKKKVVEFVEDLQSTINSNTKLTTEVNTLKSQVQLFENKELGWEAKVKKAKNSVGLLEKELEKLNKVLNDVEQARNFERVAKVKVEKLVELAKMSVIKKHRVIKK